VNDWTVSSSRGNLVVNSVTGFGNFDNVDVAFDSDKNSTADRDAFSRRRLLRAR